MKLTGKVNSSHLLHMMIEREYAFLITWENKSVRVAHYKGTWELAKIKDGSIVERVSFCDDYTTIVTPQNPLSLGLLNKLSEEYKLKGLEGNRRACSAVLVPFLEIWGGIFSQIETIEIMQDGRNATLDPSGDFALSKEVTK